MGPWIFSCHNNNRRRLYGYVLKLEESFLLPREYIPCTRPLRFRPSIIVYVSARGYLSHGGIFLPFELGSGPKTARLNILSMIYNAYLRSQYQVLPRLLHE